MAATLRRAMDACSPRPDGIWITLLLLLFAAVWLPHLAHSSLVPPTDNIEQLTWVRSLEWGYYKHPPLPTWVLWIPVQVMGLSEVATYVLGATFALAAMGLLWRLLAALRGPVHATVAVLAALCITYYNGRLYYYNHEVVLIPFAVASAGLTWKAFRTRQARWWLALGACLGLGGLAKYHIAVMALAVLAFWGWQRGWRDTHHRRGLLLAMVTALALVSPHLYWLWQHDLGPIRYAMESSLGLELQGGRRWTGSAHWLLDQLLNRALPAWFFLLLALWTCNRGAQRIPAHRHTAPAIDTAMSRRLLLCFGITPLVFTCALGLFVGADLQLHWGAPFLLLAIPAAMELGRCKRAWSAVPLKSALKAFGLVQLLLLLWGQMISANGEVRWQRHHWRNFDAQALADAVAPEARAELGGPIRLVAGPPAEAGALALRLQEKPLVLLHGRLDISPWVDRKLVDGCGVLVLSKAPKPPGYRAVGDNFPGLYWRVIAPVSSSVRCTGESNATR
ncbi:glycosyltransferase family 39 protein [Variovorax gossypii]|nr:glycosyltransferase family 39 protein [Variovorax gossypii]